MTIEELIQKLKAYPPDIVVYIDNKLSKNVTYIGDDAINISSKTYTNVKDYLER